MKIVFKHITLVRVRPGNNLFRKTDEPREFSGRHRHNAQHQASSLLGIPVVVQVLIAVIAIGAGAFPTLLLAEPGALRAGDAAFESAHFSGSANCGVCHNRLYDTDRNEVSLEKDWKTTMMAHSFRDPLWQAKVASELQRNPQIGHKIGAVCVRCHAPMASAEAATDGTDLNLFRDGLLDPTDGHFDAAMDGVSCTLCHQIENSTELGTEAGASGGFSINLSEKLAYGPKTLPRINPMRNQTGFTPTYGRHMSDSKVCGTCHDLKTKFVNTDGEPVESTPHGGFPEQMVYTEWENSDYAPGRDLEKSCQHCHMPETDGVKLANRPRWLSREDDFSRHTFLGANTVLLDIIDNNSAALGATDTDLTAAIESTRGLLATAAELKVKKHRIVDDRLQIWLVVQNLSGHKLPTGYPSRRVFLHFVLRDESRKIIFESGRIRKDGSIVGVGADNNPNKYERHYRTISKHHQVQVYEAVMGDTDGQLTHTLLEASHYVKDNRLPPLGFHKAKVPEDIAVRGVAEADGNFDNARDTVKYSVQLPPGNPGDVLTVEVELNYQPLSFAFLEDLFGDDDEPLAVSRFRRMYEASTLRVETIARLRYSTTR